MSSREIPFALVMAAASIFLATVSGCTRSPAPNIGAIKNFAHAVEGTACPTAGCLSEKETEEDTVFNIVLD